MEGNGWLVIWCIGHLVELAPADAYAPRYSKWTRSDLPIIPDPWRYQVLANSEFLVMLNQASTDREELARLLNISDNQLSHITNVDFGRGLIKCGSAIVPFMDNFPKNTQLYKLMTTKFSEVESNG